MLAGWSNDPHTCLRQAACPAAASMSTYGRVLLRLCLYNPLAAFGDRLLDIDVATKADVVCLVGTQIKNYDKTLPASKFAFQGSRHAVYQWG